MDCCKIKLPLLLVLALTTGMTCADTILINAARSGDTDTALQRIEQSVNVNDRDPTATTALHWAVYNNEVELVKALVDAGADGSAVNNYGSTPFTESAVVGNVEILRLLLEAGADPNSANPEGQTALMVLARTDNTDAAEFLLDHGADPNAREKWKDQTALMWASARSRPRMVKLLTSQGANLDARSRVLDWKRQTTVFPRAKYLPAGGFTPLLFAAREGCLECVKTLVEAGADINLTDPDEITPLHMAILNAHFDIARFLLESGANVNKWDWWGRAPLYSAVDYNTLPTGGRPDRASPDDTTSLQMIELLLNAGANTNAQLKLLPPHRNVLDDRGADLTLTIGATALIRAARAGDSTVVKLLLDHGALVNLAQLQEVTPLMTAAGLRHYAIDTRGRFTTEARAMASATLILDAGANINLLDHFGQSALHGAAFRGWNEMIRLLVNHGADLLLADIDGHTPFDAALGRIRGMGREANVVQVHEDTARLIESLISQER